MGTNFISSIVVENIIRFAFDNNLNIMTQLRAKSSLTYIIMQQHIEWMNIIADSAIVTGQLLLNHIKGQIHDINL